MDSKHKAIRALLSTMAPKRALSYIRSFDLPEEEERYLIERDVRGKSYAQISLEFHISPESIKRRRQRAYRKIADQLNHEY